jgi:hypothetical protein
VFHDIVVFVGFWLKLVVDVMHLNPHSVFKLDCCNTIIAFFFVQLSVDMDVKLHQLWYSFHFLFVLIK